MSVTVDVSGLDAMIANLERLDEVVGEYGERVAALAQQLAPFRSGALKASIRSTLNGAVATISAGGALPDGRAVFQELGFNHYVSGTHVQNAYLWPAAIALMDEFIAAVVALITG